MEKMSFEAWKAEINKYHSDVSYSESLNEVYACPNKGVLKIAGRLIGRYYRVDGTGVVYYKSNPPTPKELAKLQRACTGVSRSDEIVQAATH